MLFLADSCLFSVEYPPGSARSLNQDLTSIISTLDLSAYPDDHSLVESNAHQRTEFLHQMRSNKGVLGLMKDEVSL